MERVEEKQISLKILLTPSHATQRGEKRGERGEKSRERRELHFIIVLAQ